MHNITTVEDIFAAETGAREDIVVPEEGFLKNYFAYACPLTEAPEIFHLFVGLAMIAAVVGRKVYLPHGCLNVYPNLWMILIGSSTKTRKSTAISAGRTLLWKYDDEIVYPTDFSREAFFEYLGKRPQGLLCWSEFGAALEMFSVGYMRGTKEWLTELYDCPPKMKKILKEKTYEIEKPCISILSASTVAWLNTKLHDHDVMSGFLARFLYVVPSSEQTKILPIPPVADPYEQEAIVKELHDLARVNGVASLTEDAKAFYVEWYTKQRDGSNRSVVDERLAPFAIRLETYLLKFAMLYQIAEDRSLRIQQHNMQLAKELVEILKNNIGNLLETELVFSEEARDIHCVRKIVQNYPLGIDRSQLLRKFRNGKKRLNEAVGNLEQLDEICIDSSTRPIRYFSQSSHGARSCVI